jgi:hypothetical protein
MYSRLEPSTRANGQTASEMVKVLRPGQMVHSTQANGRTIRRKDEENSFMPTEMCMTVNG